MMSKRDSISEALEDAGGRLEDEKKPGRDDDGGGRGGRGGNGGGLGGGGKTVDGNKDSPQDEQAKRKRRSLTRDLDEQNEKIKKALEKLREIAPDSELLKSDNDAGSESIAMDLLTDETILTWTHDLDVVSGKTYRYRAKASFYSPFFARAFQLDADQENLSMDPTIVTQEGQWGEPVSLDSGTQFFVKEADPVSGDELGEATIEVFSQQGGRYWSQIQTVRG